jgi:uncharacterized protein (DUF433 family)
MDPKEIVHADPKILGGTPVFVGTRVPVDALIDFLESGETIEDFLHNYPGVSREQIFAYVDGRIARQRPDDPSDSVISPAELRRRLAED